VRAGRNATAMAELRLDQGKQLFRYRETGDQLPLAGKTHSGAACSIDAKNTGFSGGLARNPNDIVSKGGVDVLF
jgi:hypothetical protein